jgi:hypothetical protein
MGRPAATLAASLLVLAATAGGAEEQRTSWRAELEFASRYMFGGLRFSESLVLFPSLAVSRSGFTLTGYGVYYEEFDDLLEADLFLEYERGAGPLTLYGGIAAYHYDVEEGWEQTIEAYVAGTWNVTSYPTLSITRDFDIGDGWLIDASVSHEISARGQPLQGAFSLVYNAHYYREDSGFYAQLRIDAPLDLGSGWTLKPWLAYIQSFDEPEIQSTLFGGAAMSLDF